MPVPKGSTIDPARTRAAILEAATRVLYERGLDGIGVAELCTRVGVSKETLYRHFGTKDDLVDAVLRARSDRVTNWLAAAAAFSIAQPRKAGSSYHRWRASNTAASCSPGASPAAAAASASQFATRSLRACSMASTRPSLVPKCR